MDPVPFSIDVETLEGWRREGRDFAILDVREPWEIEICQFEGALNIPLDQLQARARDVPRDKPLVTVCHHGMRSFHAMQFLRRAGVSGAVNLEGGIDAWARKIDPTMGTY